MRNFRAPLQRGLRGPGLTPEQQVQVATAIAGLAGKADLTGPIFQPNPGAPDEFGGYIRLLPPLSGETLSGELLLGVVGTEFRVYENEGLGRGFRIDLSDMLSGAGTRLLSDLEVPFYRPEWYGVTGGNTFGTAPDETADLSTLCDQTLPLGAVVYLKKIYRVSSYGAFRNARGCRFIGPGDIVFPVGADPSGPSQYSGYASAIFDDDDKLESSGEEYLVAARNRLRAGSSIRTIAFGDSRYAGTGAYNGVLFDPNNFLPVILPKIGLDLGLPGAIPVNNLSVPGTTFENAWNGNTADGTPYGSATDGTTPLAVATSGDYDWMLLAFGINEFKDLANDTNRPATVEARIDSVLSNWNAYFYFLRQERPVEEMAITFLGPTSANHIRYQTTDAIKRLIVGLRRLCRLYQVHYVDLYSRWSDSIHMAHITLDGAYYPADWPVVDDRGDPSSGPLHNLDVQQAALFGMVRDHMRRWFVTGDATNRVINPPLAAQTKALTDLPSTYALGQSTHEVLAADGWDANGWVTTTRSGGGLYAEQIYRRGDTGARKTRLKATGSDSWGAWS